MLIGEGIHQGRHILCQIGLVIKFGIVLNTSLIIECHRFMRTKARRTEGLADQKGNYVFFIQVSSDISFSRITIRNTVAS